MDDKILYYPNDEKYAIMNSELNQSLNNADTFEFDVPKTNPNYDSFVFRSSMIKVLKDGVEVFYGEVREVKDNFDFTRHIYAVGELAFLFDSIQPQAKYQDVTPITLFNTIINIHNSQVDDRKKFEIGMVTVKDKNDSLYRFTNYEDTLTVLRDKLCNKLDGYLRIRKADGNRYLDLVTLDDYANPCSQPISFGKNLLDYSCNISAQDIATSVIPLGARLEESKIEGLDAHVEIGSVNEGKNYINNDVAIANFGMVRVVKVWEDVTSPEILKTKAEEWLTDAQFAKMTLELNAFDLSNLNSDIESFELGQKVRALAEPFNMDTMLPLQKKTTYINDLAKNYIVLGNTKQLSYTEQASEAASKIEDKLPQTASFLEQAKNNAMQILEGVDGGNFYHTFNENGQMTGFVAINALTEELATEKWIFNIGGFGHMKKVNGEWKDLNVAMTMDGSIVADFITSGTMQADRIHGGTLKLGGYNNQDGVLEVYAIEASKYKIEFDANCNWENDFDGVTIFYENKGKYYSSPQNLQATQVTQGIVVPEAEKIYIYWYTDNSVNDYYGLKVNRVVKTDETPTLTFLIVDSLPMSETTSKIVNNGEYFNFETNHYPYLNGDRQLLGITVRGDAKKLAARLDKNGLNVFSGDIKGSDITLGGYENAQGTIDVKNSDNQSVGTWNKDGLKVFNKDKEWLELSKGFLSGGASNGEEIGKIGFVGTYDYADRDIMTLYTKGKILLSSDGFILNGPNLNWSESLVGEEGFNVISSINFDYGYIDGVQVITGAHVEYLGVSIFNGIITGISTWS